MRRKPKDLDAKIFINTKKEDRFTDNEYEMARRYLTDPKCKGNAYLSYVAAYPQQKESSALAHSAQKLMSPGVQAAIAVIRKTWHLETVISALEGDENEMSVKEAMSIISAMGRNQRHEMSDEAPYSESTQRWAIETFLKIKGILGNRQDNSTETMPEISININQVELPTSETVIDTQFNTQGELEQCEKVMLPNSEKDC